jgi:hypothetical protein
MFVELALVATAADAPRRASTLRSGSSRSASDSDSTVRYPVVCGDPKLNRNQDLADLPPKSCSVAAEAVESVIGQIGKTKKTSRQFSVWTRPGRRFNRIDTELGPASVSFGTPCDASARQQGLHKSRIDCVSKGTREIPFAYPAILRKRHEEGGLLARLS